MSNNFPNPDPARRPPNPNDRMSEPRDGARAAAEQPPAEDAQDPSTLEAFDEEGAGIAPKE